MDPFSIAVGTVSLLDVCCRFISYLRDFRGALASVDKELDFLLDDLQAVTLVTTSIKTVYDSYLTRASERPEASGGHAGKLWRNVDQVLADCRARVQKLGDLVESIKWRDGSKISKRFDGFLKLLHKQSKEQEYQQFRRDLANSLDILQMLLNATELSYHIESQSASDQLSGAISTLNSKIESLQPLLEFSSVVNLRDAIESAAAVVSLASVNKYFSIPEPVSSIYTGREGLLGELRKMMFAPTSAAQGHTQRRFVIYGLSGSGKTQFCCKFAQDHRQSFWGVFWIDASSDKTTQQAFARLAKVGGVDPNERAVKDWLSNLEDPWLLIIDSADDSEVKVETLFPEGERGHILITTRDPSHKVHGTKARPVRNTAIEQAEHDKVDNVYSSIEMNYTRFKDKRGEAASDAVELLNLFSFFHCENIRVDILTQAAKNPSIQRNADELEKQKPRMVTSTSKHTPWAKTFNNMKFAVLASLFRDRSGPVLPRVLRDSDLEPFDEDRLRDALRRLSKISLITYNALNDSYSVHSLVHRWVRESPKMMTAEHAVWCEAAATTLAQSILLPPLASQTSDEDFRRDLLPHVGHVLNCRSNIQKRILENSRARNNHWRSKLWAVPESRVDSKQAFQLARYSLVYAQSGRWDVAEKLQLKVRDFVSSTLGLEHPIAMRIQEALSVTYYWLGRGDEAAELRDEILQNCINTLGIDDHMTLKAMDNLAVSRAQQGRFREALNLQEAVLEGMNRTLAADHHDLLKALDHFGILHSRYFRWNGAREAHSKALAGMTRTLGDEHIDTLFAKENLAVVYLEIGGDLLEPAQKLAEEVLAIRQKKLGEQHGYTLLAKVHLTRAQTARGNFEEAERALRDGLEIGERNFGADHIGVLYGRMHLGKNLVGQKRYGEAEEVLRDSIGKYDQIKVANGGKHPDRLTALQYLMECYEVQGRISEATAVCDETMARLSALGGDNHALMKQLKNKRDELLGREMPGEEIATDLPAT
ncbi:hypothetical protein MMC30_005378 [Trapelia coarctata]|nr:hypothetical protein [Trapelia coarctata]